LGTPALGYPHAIVCVEHERQKQNHCMYENIMEHTMFLTVDSSATALAAACLLLAILP